MAGCPAFAGSDNCFCELSEPYEVGLLVEATAVSLLVVTDFFFCLKLKSALPSYSTACDYGFGLVEILKI